MTGSAKTSGFAEFAALLESIPRDIGESDLRSVAVAGGTVLRDEAVERAPAGGTGNLKRALYLKFIEERSTPTSKVYYVSIRRGKKPKKGEEPTDAAYYGQMVEFGHWYVPPKPKGVRWAAHRKVNIGKKWVPAKPFLRPAYEAKRTAAVDAMRERLKQRLLEKFKGSGNAG
ncbi:HK97 gp10 family phage protein [Burkholderia plantarii]|uniref:HK97 gp10 family phage protein n=1 Tax=Burkholderia plantarii TaxID=41899 RepID=UPI002729E5AA|nr:HK97 gp10 family phage protein [Burkholderia plantarii]WLE60237.1 HK97 gp10 family phage protein [Burkholderia plantarii]